MKRGMKGETEEDIRSKKIRHDIYCYNAMFLKRKYPGARNEGKNTKKKDRDRRKRSPSWKPLGEKKEKRRKGGNFQFQRLYCGARRPKWPNGRLPLFISGGGGSQQLLLKGKVNLSKSRKEEGRPRSKRKKLDSRISPASFFGAS